MRGRDGESGGPGARPGRTPDPTREDDPGEVDDDAAGSASAPHPWEAPASVGAPGRVEDPGAAGAPDRVEVPNPETVAAGDGGEAGDGDASAGSVLDAPADADAALDPVATERVRAAKYLALAQRTQADFENYRKRVAREATVAETRGAGRVARELLPALDNLALALDAADGEGEGDGHLAQGIRLVQAELHAALRRVGIEPFSPNGERFDPALHEAMAAQPAEGVEPGTVLEVYQRGYRHHDTVLRPARVVVSAAAG